MNQFSVLERTRLLVLAAGLLLSFHAAADWPTTDWHIECHESIPGIGGPGDCGPSQDATSSPRFLMQALVEGSQWLEGLGYRAPALRMGSDPVAGQTRSDGYYTAYLFHAPEVCHLGICADNASGVYFGRWRESQWHEVGLYVSHNSIFSGSSGSLGTAVHELFHGIQYAYEPFQKYDVAGWITEGTARAIGNEWLIQRGYDRRHTHRSYSDPLHEPGNAGGIYGTSSFWRSIGVEDGWDTFHTLFQEELSGNGLAGIDEGLRAAGTEGLTEAYLRFVERIGQREAQRAYLDACAELEVDPDSPEDDHSTLVAPVATECFRVRASAASDAESCLRVEVEPEDGRQDLHLLRGSRRYPRLLDSESLLAGARFDEHYQLVNAADQTEESQQRAATLKVSLDPAEGQCGQAWALNAGGPPIGSVMREGKYATFSISDHRIAPGSGYYDALARPDSAEPSPPWLHIEMESHHLLEDAETFTRLARTGRGDEAITSIRITAPNCPTGCTGELNEPWITVSIDGEGFRSNADSAVGPIEGRYYRGRLRTAEVHIERHDEQWLEGSFSGRLAPTRRTIPEGMAATQRAESIWHYPDLEIQVSGHFRARIEPDTDERAAMVLEHIGLDPGMMAAAEKMAEQMREREQNRRDPEPEAEPEPRRPPQQRPDEDDAEATEESERDREEDEASGGLSLQVDIRAPELHVGACRPGVPGDDTRNAMQVIAEGRTRGGQEFQVQTGQVGAGMVRQVISAAVDDRLYNAMFVEQDGVWRESRGDEQAQAPITLDGSTIRVDARLADITGGEKLDFELELDCSEFD